MVLVLGTVCHTLGTVRTASVRGGGLSTVSPPLKIFPCITPSMLGLLLLLNADKVYAGHKALFLP